MNTTSAIIDRLKPHVNRSRLMETALRLIEVPSPTGDAGAVSDRLEEIRAGHRGDAVLLPEPLRDVLPVAGRGSATWKAVIRRSGPPVHEVMRPMDQPSVIAAAAELVARVGRLGDELSASPHPICGPAS